MNSLLKIALSLVFVAGLVACEPQQMDRPNVDPAPQPGQTKILLTRLEDPNPPIDTTYILAEDKSSIKGIQHWSVSGITPAGKPISVKSFVASAPSISLKLKKAGTYKVVLLLNSNGGVGQDSTFFTIE